MCRFDRDVADLVSGTGGTDVETVHGVLVLSTRCPPEQIYTLNYKSDIQKLQRKQSGLFCL